MTATKDVKENAFGGKPRINMDLKCVDNAGAELGLTIDAIYQQPLAYPPLPRDTLIKVTDNTPGRRRWPNPDLSEKSVY